MIILKKLVVNDENKSLNIKIFLLGTLLLGNIKSSNGKIEKEQINEIINEIIIIIPKSIIGLMSVKIKDPKATIVVSDV